MSVAVSVRLPERLAAELGDVASATERSKSFVIQKALEAYLEEQADLQIALDRLNDPTDATISLEDMRSELAL
ncbi:ribbon-helix-helix domain-containing protein [Desulfonatronum sp. SC1]|uniref:type II toxin-antitoxin system RelB family antitoxin n=1 Tax=Desulfonatronum sp. SC1 TaxID=2109626 RepID=UPI000D30DE45|nr:ribbon-helix-helix domain-containing protein [Desulfonatronum sp. SC1]PTN36726.1 DNA-binding protein [Desulfonatronum sp. SC1]